MWQIAAALGVKAAADYFGGRSEAEEINREREARFKNLLAQIEADRVVELRSGLGALARTLRTREYEAQSMAGYRSAGAGRRNLVEAFRLPAEEAASRGYLRATESLTQSVNQRATAAKRAAQSAYAERPIERGPTLWDVIGTGAEAYGSYEINKELMKNLFPQVPSPSGSKKSSMFPSFTLELPGPSKLKPQMGEFGTSESILRRRMSALKTPDYQSWLRFF